MRFYHIPDPRTLNEAELIKLQGIADQFNKAVRNLAGQDAKLLKKLDQELTQDERRALAGMGVVIRSLKGNSSALEKMMSLQITDLMADVLTRIDPALSQKCVPENMVTADAAGLFRAYRLSSLEKLARNSFQPPKP